VDFVDRCSQRNHRSGSQPWFPQIAWIRCHQTQLATSLTRAPGVRMMWVLNKLTQNGCKRMRTRLPGHIHGSWHPEDGDSPHKGSTAHKMGRWVTSARNLDRSVCNGDLFVCNLDPYVHIWTDPFSIWTKQSQMEQSI
jgi:hypothetical protein